MNRYLVDFLGWDYGYGDKDFRYLVDFLGWDYGYGDKDLIQYEVEAWSEEEARQKVLRDKSNIVLSEIGVHLLEEYSEADHHERELRMEQGI